MPGVVVDAGGTFVRCAVADDNGGLSNISRAPIPNYLSASDGYRIWPSIVDIIVSYVTDVAQFVDAGNSIVFAVPGPVVDHSKLLKAPTIVGPQGGDIPDFASVLSERTGRNVYLLNDVSAAAWRIGSIVADERFFVVTVSSGIGSKLYDRRHPERVFDAKPFSGEIGHTVVDDSQSAPICDCGARGHLGAISSGRGTERFARLVAEMDMSTYRASALYQQFLVQPHELTNEHHLVPAARNGDAWARSIIATSAEPLARALATIIVAAALDRVFIVGGFAQGLGEVYADILARHLSHFLLGTPFARPGYEYVRVIEPNEEVCLAGAAAIFRERLKAPV